MSNRTTEALAPAQMGITSTATPEVLQVLDNTGTWVPVGQVESGVLVPIGAVSEAPTDGNKYGRQNAAWTVIGGAVSGTSANVYDSIAGIQAANVPSGLQNISCLSYGVPGDLQGYPMQYARAIPDLSVYKTTLANSAGNESGTHIRLVLPPPITPVGTGPYQAVVTLVAGPGTVAGQIDNAYVGMGATTGFASNFDGSQVQLKFNGATGVSGINGYTKIVSDPIPITYVAGRAFTVAFHVSGTNFDEAHNGYAAGSPEYYGNSGPSSDTGLSSPTVPLGGAGGNISVNLLSISFIPATFTIPVGFVRSADRYLPNGVTNAAAGGYWALTNQVVTPKMFGAPMVGDAAADDHPAIANALAYAAGNSGRLHFPGGNYYSSATINVTGNMQITGEATGIYLADSLSKIQFPVGVTGMSLTFPDTTATYGISIDGLQLVGTTDPTGASPIAHGITANCGVSLHRVTCSYFTGNGFDLPGYNFPGTPQAGFTDLSKLDECNAVDNQRSGFFAVGQDANVITFIKCSAGGNGWYGYWDDSFLGCNFISCHSASNGAGGGISGAGGCLVNHGGTTYCVVPVYEQLEYWGSGAPAQNPSNTAPGADTPLNSIWYPMAPTSTTGAANWVNGTHYNPGGPYCNTNLAAKSVWDGCYTETSGGYTFYIGAEESVIIGGLQGGTIVGPFYTAAGNAHPGGINSLWTPVVGVAGDSQMTVVFGAADPTGGQAMWWGQTYNPTTAYNAWYARIVPTLGDFSFVGNGYTEAYRVTNSNTTWQFGSSAPQPYVLSTPALALSATGNGMIQTFGTAAPTTGAHGKGWIVWNTNAAPSGFAGWICTTAGTPGTWKTFGVISP